MKTICVMRDVFKAMARFEDAFEKVEIPELLKPLFESVDS